MEECPYCEITMNSTIWSDLWHCPVCNTYWESITYYHWDGKFCSLEKTNPPTQKEIEEQEKYLKEYRKEEKEKVYYPPKPLEDNSREYERLYKNYMIDAENARDIEGFNYYQKKANHYAWLLGKKD